MKEDNREQDWQVWYDMMWCLIVLWSEYDRNDIIIIIIWWSNELWDDMRCYDMIGYERRQ